MGCLGLILLLFITLPVVFILLFLNVVTISFSKLGLSPDAAFMLLFAILIGSTINLPISRRRIAYRSPRPSYMHFFFYRPPPVTHQVITVNVGGAIVPVGFALYLLHLAPLVPTLIATGIMVMVTRWLAKPVSGLGIAMPFWIPPYRAWESPCRSGSLPYSRLGWHCCFPGIIQRPLPIYQEWWEPLSGLTCSTGPTSGSSAPMC